MVATYWVQAARFPSIDCLPKFPPFLSAPAKSLSFFAESKLQVLGSSSRETLARVNVVESRYWTSSSETHQGLWEDPDDGSESEYEEEDEEEENSSDFEGEAAGFLDNGQSTRIQYENDLLREVEQFLGPEERAILQQNVTPNLAKISTDKWKPLQTLGLSMQIPFMDNLLENGLDINEVDKDGLTALHKAIIGKKEAVLSHLLRKGASPHVKDKNGATPLHYAVQVGALQTVKLLIKYNVDVNAADDDGWTPLHIAVQSRNRYIVKLLLVNGADKTRRNKDGKTALDLSLCYGKDFKSYDLAKLLKIVPADRNL